MLIKQKYGTREQFLVTMNPSIQAVAAKHPDRCHFGTAPTLGMLKKTYGDSMAGTWLVPQLNDLAAFTNSTNQLNGQAVEFVADAIAQEYYYLKTSELLLFFYRFKLGYYGRFYGTVDPMIITMAIREFLKERAEAIRQREQEQQKQELEQSMQGAISASEFCRRNGLPEMDMATLIQKLASGEIKHNNLVNK